MTKKRASDIVKQTKIYTAAGGELGPGQRFGPFACGGKCRDHHAFAIGVEQSYSWREGGETKSETYNVIMFERPCLDSVEASLSRLQTVGA